MPIHLKEKNILFTMSPGTGSSALEKFLKEQAGQYDEMVILPDEKGVKSSYSILADTKHCTYENLKAAGVIDDDDITIVTGIRNPWDYWYSEWYRTRTRWIYEIRDINSWVVQDADARRMLIECCTMDFSDWIEFRFAAAAKNGTQIQINAAHTIEADHFLRMESLEQDLHGYLRTVYGDAVGEFPQIAQYNTTKKPNNDAYWQHYTPKARTIITTVMRAYIDRFGYLF